MHYTDHTPRGRGRPPGDIWGLQGGKKEKWIQEPVSQNDYKKVSKLGSGRAWELLAQAALKFPAMPGGHPASG